MLEYAVVTYEGIFLDGFTAVSSQDIQLLENCLKSGYPAPWKLSQVRIFSSLKTVSSQDIQLLANIWQLKLRFIKWRHVVKFLACWQKCLFFIGGNITSVKVLPHVSFGEEAVFQVSQQQVFASVVTWSRNLPISWRIACWLSAPHLVGGNHWIAYLKYLKFAIIPLLSAGRNLHAACCILVWSALNPSGGVLVYRDRTFFLGSNLVRS